MQVPIPHPLASHMVLLATVDGVLCFTWERMLRNFLPALRPPTKGYMAHAKELGLTPQTTSQTAGLLDLEPRCNNKPLDLDKLE